MNLRHRTTARAEPPITALCFSRQGDCLLVASQRGLKIYEPTRAFLTKDDAGETIERLPPAIHDLQFSPDGDCLLISRGVSAELGSVTLLDWSSRSLLWRKEIGEDIVYGSDWSPDGMFIATASFDSVCRILNRKEGRTEQSLAGHSAGLADVAWVDPLSASIQATFDVADRHVGAWVTALAVRPDGEAIVVGSSTGKVE